MNRKLKVLFRVDSGAHIGMGHLSRCQNLAKAFLKINSEVTFLCKSHFGNRNQEIKKPFHLVEMESEIKELPSGMLEEKDWIGGDWKDDLGFLNRYIEDHSIDLVVLDHYSISFDYESRIKSKNILVIDDMMNRPHCARWILDHNLSAKREKYAKLNQYEGSPVYMLGPRFALLDPRFAENYFENERQIKKILVFFGSTDLTHDTLKVINAYKESSRQYEITILLPIDHPTYKLVEEIASSLTNVSILNRVDDMASLISQHDLCFGAGGVTTWERMCLARPTVMITSARNQNLISDIVKEKGLAIVLGDGNKTTQNDWLEMINSIEDLKEKFFEQANLGRAICDGLGTERVSKEIYESFNSN